LSRLLTEKKNLILDNCYYFLSNSLNVEHDFTIRGNGNARLIVVKGQTFLNPQQNSSLSVIDVDIISQASYFILAQRVDYKIHSLIFKGCNYNGGRIVECTFADNDYALKQFGFDNFVVEDCEFTSPNSLFVLSDAVVSQTCSIRRNIFNDMHYTGFSVGTTNEFTHSDANRIYWCDMFVEDNVVHGGISDTNTYCTFLLAEVNAVYYRRNVVKNLLNIGSGVAYDAYVSSVRYFSENNVFENIATIPATGIVKPTMDEIGKSKGEGKARYFANNTWRNDYTEIRQLLSEYISNLSDEVYSQLCNLAIFLYAGEQADIKFTNNIVEIVSGTLCGSPSTIDMNRLSVTRNYFHCNINEFVSIQKGKVEIRDNVFIGSENRKATILFRTNERVAESLVFEDNILNFSWLAAQSTYFKNVSIKNNRFIDAVPTNLDNVYLPIEKESSILDYIWHNERSDATLHVSKGAKVTCPSISPILTRTFQTSSAIAKIEIEIPSVNEVVRYIFKVENGETNIYDIDGNLIATPTGVYGLSLYWKNGIRLYGAKANGDKVWFIIKFEKQQEVIVNITTYDTFDFDAIKKVGSTSDRPNTQYILVGYQYFDKTLQKPIWWNGTSWIDATGANV
jgi:acetyltransferase-like isoleucine patch superfamily enzyme